MANESGASGDGDDGGFNGEGERVITAKTDFGKLFATNLGLRLRAGGRHIVANGDSVTLFGRDRPDDSPARERAALAGLDLTLAASVDALIGLVVDIEDARDVIRQRARTITMTMVRR